MRTVSHAVSLSVALAVCTAAVVSLADAVRAADPQAPAIQSAATAKAPAAVALKNLIEAYDRESNAREFYSAAARKADQEGYRKAAELFRGAARAQEIHLGFYAKNITKLGGTPAADIKSSVIKSTRENLAAAVGEIEAETTALYPNYLAHAKMYAVPEAAKAFGSGIVIRNNQKAIFQKALADLASWKKASGGLYVCLVCGNLVEKLNFTTCAVCAAPLKEFALVK